MKIGVIPQKSSLNFFHLAPPDYLHYTKKELRFFWIKNILGGFQGHKNDESYKKKLL